MNEHDSVELMVRDPKTGLEAGSVGAIVVCSPGVSSVIVEFYDSDGRTTAVTEIERSLLRPRTRANDSNQTILQTA